MSGSGDIINFWNIQERKEDCTFTGHKKKVASVALSADGRYIVSGSYEKKENSGVCKNGGNSTHLRDTRTPLDQWL